MFYCSRRLRDKIVPISGLKNLSFFSEIYPIRVLWDEVESRLGFCSLFIFFFFLLNLRPSWRCTCTFDGRFWFYGILSKDAHTAPVASALSLMPNGMALEMKASFQPSYLMSENPIHTCTLILSNRPSCIYLTVTVPKNLFFPAMVIISTPL